MRRVCVVPHTDCAMAGKTDADKLPKIYFVNWFRKDASGSFVWPGFGENSRVLAWIAGRLEGTTEATESPLGLLPAKGSLDTTGLTLSEAELDLLLTLDREVWREEVALIPAHYEKFGDHLPKELWAQLQTLQDRLAD